MIAGSNPNADVETRKYHTEYQVEYISPVGLQFRVESVWRLIVMVIAVYIHAAPVVHRFAHNLELWAIDYN